MRIIPKKTKVTTEFFRGVRLSDVIVGFCGLVIMVAVLLSSLPGKLWIEIVLFFILGLLVVRIDDDPNYMLVLQLLRHFSYERRFQKKGQPLPQAQAPVLTSKQLEKQRKEEEEKLLKSDEVSEEEKAAIRQKQKQDAEERYLRAKLAEQEKKRVDIRKMTLVSGISEGFIQYGSQYFGAVIEIPAVELRFFSQTRRTNAIDRAVGSVIRSIGTSYSANIVKLERPMILDKHIQAEYDKIDALRRNYEQGVINEDEMRSRTEVIYQRINSLRNYNQDDKVLIPHFYLVLFDSDKRQLDNQVQSAIGTLEQGEMLPRRLNDKELAVFLRYTNSVDFDEREIENVAPEDYVSFLLPDSLEIKGRTVEVNSIITHNFRVISYPVSVDDAWGAPLFDIPGTKVVMKITQMDRNKSIRAIDRSISELTSQLEHTSISSRVLELQTHIETLSQLLAMLQNNNENLMAMNMYITAYDIAATRKNKLLVPQPPPSSLPRVNGMKRSVKRSFTEQGFKLTDMIFQQFETYVATQVNAYDPMLDKAIGIPSSTLAAVFPWIYPIVNDVPGLNLGATDGIPTFVNFFRRDDERVNSNMVIVGKSGGGKSYATKSILSNLAADDSKIFVLDPENEYAELAGNLKGKYINVANSTHGRINPFQIITTLEDDEASDGQETSSYSAHLQFLEEFFRQILPEIDHDALEYLNTLIIRVYMQKGIDRHTSLSSLKPEDYPIFDDLYDCILEEFQRTNSDYLRSNLRVLMNYINKFSTGGRNASMWNGPSTLSTVENFIVFNFQSLLANRNNTIANAQMLLVLKYLDNEIIKNRDHNLKYGAKRKIIVVIDEAHVFIDSKYPLALDFMYQMAKRIRKYNGMQIVITQNIKDFVGSEELARKSTAIINACQYSVIFSLAPNDMHDLCTLYEKAGGINPSEQEKIISARRGEAFLITSPTSRTSMNIITPKTVEDLFTQETFQSRFFDGEDGAQNWEDVIGASRPIRQQWEKAKAAAIYPDEPKRKASSRFGGVTLVEVQEEAPVEETVVIPVTPAVTAPVKPIPAEPVTAPAAPAAPELETELLKRFSYDALVSEIRRTVRQELEAELGQRQNTPPAATAAPMPASQPVPMEPSPDYLFSPASFSENFFGDLSSPAPAEPDAADIESTPDISSAVDALFDDLFIVSDEPEQKPADPDIWEIKSDEPDEPKPEPEKKKVQPEASKVFEASLDDLMNMED